MARSTKGRYNSTSHPCLYARHCDNSHICAFAKAGSGIVFSKGPLKSAKVKASKLRTPDTELVRRDIQPWPQPTQHTQSS